MKNKDPRVEQHDEKGKRTPGKWSGLSLRMTLSYIMISVSAVLLLELLAGLVVFWLRVYGPFDDQENLSKARRMAQFYAMAASIQGGGVQLNPHSTFLPGQPASLIGDQEQASDLWKDRVPSIEAASSDPQQVKFALLIGPTGRVLASSYPAHIPVATPLTHLPSPQSRLSADALAGRSGTMVEVTSQGRVRSAAATVWSRDRRPIGAIYVQFPPDIAVEHFLLRFLGGWFTSGLGLLVITVPIGLFFGMMTTRQLIQRLRHLVVATTRFADGEYSQRVALTSNDEVGQLELQFNWMAERLVESIAQGQALTQHTARLEERARIARDLHDSVKQHLFAVSMQIGAALSLPEHRHEQVHQYLKEIDMLAYQAQQDLTTLIQELRPSLLRNKGLGVALRDYLEMWSRQNAIRTEVQIAETGVRSQALEETLWRVAQEALANVARHSQASTVQIRLEDEQKQVMLSLVDNGCGFDPTKRERWGIGLDSMKERMEALGGTLTIHSEVGKGTRITVRCRNSQALVH
ncbi:hypothetical protein KSD_95390 [Ktedonobacter sp. SOSP1-85]|uniref:HAMP domain-containing sensor histidine kinase n=1 Tax=Ktedonobacter sp. SOSP1-85 TaxID=2778367 RepID=UPI001915F7F1|nr:sensor histidine kinase [Ktedonobacter sp. SOSP1-85]GHO81768.1 hypothetical protein KSD_95390 [Ktedonobacter sp. SOSP1-85]